jgi:hypothetical protein
MKTATSALTGSDWAELREGLATVSALLKKKYNGADLTQTANDLPLLQRILDDGVYDATETAGLTGIGTALGNIVEKQLHFEWVAVDDNKGRTPALKLKAAQELIVFPIRLVLDPVAADRPVYLADIYKRIQEDAKRTRLV